MTVACTGIQLGGNKYRATRTDEEEKSFPVESVAERYSTARQMFVLHCWLAL